MQKEDGQLLASYISYSAIWCKGLYGVLHPTTSEKRIDYTVITVIIIRSRFSPFGSNLTANSLKPASIDQN